MKKIYLLLFTVLSTIALWSQTKTWNGGNGSWIDATKWTPAIIPVTDDSVVFNNGTAGIISNVPAITLKRVTVTGNTSITLQSPGSVKLITLDNANKAIGLLISTGSSLTMGTNVDIVLDKVSANISGELNITSGRSFDTDKANSETTVTGTIDNKGVIVSKGNALTFADGGSYIHSQNGGTIPDATWDKNSNCLITGVINSMPAGIKKGLHFGNFEWNNPGQVPFPINTMPSFNGNLEHIDGNFIIKNTGTGSVFMSNSGNYDATVGGNYIQTGGILVLNQAGGKGTMIIKGNFNMSGGTLARNNSNAGDFSAIKFIGSGSQSFSKTGGIISGKIDFSVEPNAIVNMGTSVLEGSAATFTINDGSKIITSHPNGLNSTGAIGSIQTLVRSFSEKADYEFQGAATGVFNTGSSTNTTASNVNNLTINNISGSVILSKPIIIAKGSGANRLYLQNGALITSSTNILTLNDDVPATGVPGFQPNNYSPASFVDGPLKKVGNDAFTFPVGKVGSGLHKIGITVPIGGQNTTTSFTAEFIRQNPQTLSNTLVTSLARISACEYWTLDRTSTNQVRVILSWDNNSGCPGQYVTDIPTLRVARFGGGMWQNDGNFATSASGNNSTGTITSDNVITTFSPFALASSSAITNPLPVSFADVKAYEKNSGVQIEWSNLTEKDLVEYTVERSSNGRDFTIVSKQLPSSNQNDKASYIAYDATPLSGINYYRIKTEETSGKIVYSKILSINKNNLAGGLMLYPNPATSNQVTISLTNLKRGPYNLRLVTSTGQDLYKQTITNFSSYMSQTINLPASIKPGVYNLIIAGNDYRESKMLIIR